MLHIIILVVLAFAAYIVFFLGLEFFPALLLAFKDMFHRLLFARKSEPIYNGYGVHIFCGRVGQGKTISLVRRIRRIKRKYPKVKIYSNFHCSLSDGIITSWRDIIDITNIDENGINQGVIFMFDELHLTLSSQGWRDAPDNLLEYISLQRHLHKCIYGTTQVWSRVNKILREQTDSVTECKSLLNNRLILNRCYTAEDYQINGELRDSGVRRRPLVSRESFVATDELRSYYDTDEIVTSLSIK